MNTVQVPTLGHAETVDGCAPAWPAGKTNTPSKNSRHTNNFLIPTTFQRTTVGPTAYNQLPYLKATGHKAEVFQLYVQVAFKAVELVF